MIFQTIKLSTLNCQTCNRRCTSESNYVTLSGLLLPRPG